MKKTNRTTVLILISCLIISSFTAKAQTLPFYVNWGSVPNPAWAPIWQSCIPDSRTSLNCTNVVNTGSDIFDNGTYRVEAFVNDGASPQLVVIDNNTIPATQAPLPSTAIDPDVVIINDAIHHPLDFYINVVYYNTATSQYTLDIFYFTPTFGVSSTPIFSYNLMSAPFGSGANIDVDESGENGAITFEANGNIYGCVCGTNTSSSPAPTAACQVGRGTKPDVAIHNGDIILFSFINNSTSSIDVESIILGNLTVCNTTTTWLVSFPMLGTALDFPRIAADPNSTNWSVVWCDLIPTNNTYSIFGNTGTGLPSGAIFVGSTIYEYSNSFTWPTTPSTPVNMSLHTFFVTNPTVSYNRNSEIEVGFIFSEDPACALPSCISTALGVVCDAAGQPVAPSCYPTATPIFQFIPFETAANACATTPAINSTGVEIYGYQSALSMAGKNSVLNEFMSAYFDNDPRCNQEIVYKDGYNSSSGFRQTKPKNVINTAANKLILSISPNPFTENIKITSTNNDANCNLIITDISGREILNTNGTIEQLNSALVVCNTKLNAGIYFINIKNDSGILLNQKIVKQ
jgi:hypothetical protein